MSAAATAVDQLVANPVVVKAITDAVESGLTMCDLHARCVGISSVPVGEPGTITGLIGIHGEVSGFVSLNLPEAVARAAVGGLLQDRFDKLTAQVIDGVGELANIIAGGIKRGLAGSKWGFSHVTVPSVIVGRNYQIAYAKGLEYVCATFEHDSDETFLLEDRLIHVAASMIRL
jgi:chemotaxis protein CheX